MSFDKRPLPLHRCRHPKPPGADWCAYCRHASLAVIREQRAPEDVPRSRWMMVGPAGKKVRIFL